jgi:methionine synthase II (cobalamin-independent)
VTDRVADPVADRVADPVADAVTDPPRRLPAGVATGVGSLPGDDIDRALAMVFEELPDLPHLPELPARGPGADMVGRTATGLVDLPVDLSPSGWRLVSRPGLDRRRGQELLGADLDALLPVAGPGYDGPLKVALAGPWTLAASVQLPRGGPALADSGAMRDVTDSLLETVAAHLDDVRRRVPHAQLMLQIDEPSLPAVLGGRIRTESGLGVVATPEAATVQDTLARVVAAAAGVPVVVHCCADDAPLGLFAGAGAAAVGVDMTAAPPDHDLLGGLVESDVTIWLGVVPALGPGTAPTAGSVASTVRTLWHELGFPAERLPGSVVLTPTCGLAGASTGWAHSAYRLLRQAAKAVSEAPEGIRG